jgi:gliding motility-associated-like protein
VDIGAYEFQVVKTKITTQPQGVRVCEKTPVQLFVTAQGTVLTYQWQRNGVNLAEKTDPTLTIEGTIADIGTYRLIAMGACCNDTSVNVRVDVEKCLDSSDVTVNFENGCFAGDGWAQVVISDKPTTYPFAFLWNDGSTDSLRTALNTGNYTVTITDVMENTVVKTITISLVPPMEITLTAIHAKNEFCDDGEIKAIVLKGTPPYYYLWSDDSIEAFNQPDRNNMKYGTYTLTVADSKGCEQKADISLKCVFQNVVPNMFISPNEDGKNDVLKIKYIERFPNNRVIIINTYGEQVRGFINYNNTTVVWDGKNEKGQVLPDGVYYYILEAEGIEPMTGWVLMKGSMRNEE